MMFAATRVGVMANKKGPGVRVVTPDIYFSNVSLLVPGGGSSTAVTEMSSFSHSATCYGDAAYSAAQSKFGGTALYFDGTGDYVAFPDSDAFYIPADFTAEAWVYIDGGTVGIQAIMNQRGSSGIQFNITYTAGVYQQWCWINSTHVFTYQSGAAIPSSQWVHLAWTRSGNVFRSFINGVLNQSATLSLTVPNDTGPLTLSDGSGYGQFFKGYMEDVRITKGIARYTANFTPPTALSSYADAGTTDPYISDVSLLLHGDGANGSTTFIDSVGSNTFTAYGNSVISTAQSKFGGSSMYFDGSGDYIQAPHNAVLNFGTGDFTIEWWMYCAVAWTSMTNNAVYDKKPNDSTPGIVIYRNTVNDPTTVNVRLTGSIDFTSLATPETQTWEHWALTRQGETLRWFKNGVLTNTHTGVTYNLDNTGVLQIGRSQTWGGFFNGYIDDMRITKGVARYTASFTPPTAPFPDA